MCVIELESEQQAQELDFSEFQTCSVEYTMPWCTASEACIRSVSLPNCSKAERFTTYGAHYLYRVSMDALTAFVYPDDREQPDGWTPRGIFLAISVHLCVERCGLYHHDETAKRDAARYSCSACGHQLQDPTTSCWIVPHLILRCGIFGTTFSSLAQTLGRGPWVSATSSTPSSLEGVG